MNIPPSTIPNIPVPGWPVRFSSDELLRFEPPIGEAEARWWWSNFIDRGRDLYPRRLAEWFVSDMPGKLWCKYTVVSVEQERLSFEIGGLDDTGENIWYSGFTVNIDDNNFFKDLTFIESGYQNEDLGTLLMSRCYELARLLKLDQIRLHAMWAGAYAWARFGFIPNKAEWNDTMKANVTSRLLVLKKDIPHKLFLEMLRFLESEDPAVVWSIADERYPVPSAEMSDEDGQPLQIPLGRALLAESGTSWYGFLDLSDQLAVERFEEYVGVV